MKSLLKRTVSLAVSAVMMTSVIPMLQPEVDTYAMTAVPEGFVYTKGTQFMCDGSPYYYAGTNCYYLTFKPSIAVDNVIEDAADMGLKVIRVWGNIDAGTKTGEVDSNGFDVFTNNADKEGHKDGYYFQYFDKDLGRPVVNEGANGLQSLDYALYKAEQEGIKLIITFTNYWEAFGGVEQYIKWAEQAGITNLKKDDFYTNETLKQWYKDYIDALLNHENVYTGKKLKDESSVFAWELANEPRCATDAQCENNVLYNWAKEMSEYVKSIDPYHMVSVGDEGFFNYEYNSIEEAESNYVWYGADGVDYDQLMTIDTIDFGTPHFYVDTWNMKITNGSEEDLLWLRMHAESAEKADKPVVLEEFGLTDKTLRDEKFTNWLDLMTGDYYEGMEYAGFNYWMIASYMEDGSLYPDYDNYTVYGPADVEITSSTRKLIVDAAAKMNAKNICNVVNPQISMFDRSQSGDVTVSATMKLGQISGLSLDGSVLVSGRDYTVSGNNITVKKDFLSDLELSEYKFTVLTTEGNKPEFYIDVDDSTVALPELSEYAADIDKNVKKCQDIEITMQKNGSELRGIKNGTASLTEGSDYTILGDKVTLKKSYLTSLPKGKSTLVFDFYEGKDRNFVITATDTTGEDELDTFESYASNDELAKAYIRNSGGNELSVSLANKNGSQAMKFDYKIDNPDYCGVNKAIKGKDFTNYKGISLWLEGDGSGNEITIQLRDSNDNYWETYIDLNFTGGKTIQVPFEDFKAPSWQSGGNTINTAGINQLAIYAGGNTSTKSGTVYFDDIIAYGDDFVVVEKPYIIENSKTYDAKNPTDVKTSVKLYDTTLSSVSYAGSDLSNGSDYTVSGSTVTIKDSWLANLENGSYNLTFKFSDGTTDTLKVTVTNKGNVEDNDAVLNTTYAEFDLNNQQNVSASVTFNGKTIKSLKLNDKTLSEGTDYTASGNIVTINKNTLNAYSEGTYTLTFEFSNDKNAQMTLKVVNSYVDPGDDEFVVIDSFDNVNSSAYVRNSNGNNISVTGENGKGKISYTVGNPDYAGVTKSLSNMNWSEGKKVTFELTSDVSGRDVVFQIRDRNGNYFECRKTVNAGNNTVEINLNELKAPSWAGNNTADFSAVSEYSIYIEKGSANDGSGNMYIDNLHLIINDGEGPVDPDPVEDVVIDSFDNVNSYDYNRNYNGNEISISGENGKGKISYRVGNPDYAGLTKYLSNMNWSDGNKIKFELTSDVAGRDIVFQIRDRNGNYFECRKSVSAGTSTVEIPLSELKAPSWSGNNTADFSSVSEYSIYIENGSAGAGSGTMYINNLVLAK